MEIFFLLLWTFPVFWLRVAVHEFGHWFVARILGFKVIEFSVGGERGSVIIPLKDFVFSFGPSPLEGRVLYLNPPDTPNWKTILICLAGVGMELAILPLTAFLLYPISIASVCVAVSALYGIVSFCGGYGMSGQDLGTIMSLTSSKKSA